MVESISAAWKKINCGKKYLILSHYCDTVNDIDRVYDDSHVHNRVKTEILEIVKLRKYKLKI